VGKRRREQGGQVGRGMKGEKKIKEGKAIEHFNINKETNWKI